MKFLTLENYKKIKKAIEYAAEYPNTSNTQLERLFGVSRKNRILSGKREEIYDYKYIYDDRIYSLTEEEEAAAEEFNEAEYIFKQDILRKYNIGKAETLNHILEIKGYDTKAKHLKIYNRDLFKEIKTEEDAYWLGFITADGYLLESRGWLSIKLGKVDRGHLVKFAKYAGLQDPEKEIKIEKGGVGQDVVCLKLYSKAIVENLTQYGLKQSKSGEETFADIDKSLIKHYMRGLFDGDGGFTVNSQKGVIDRLKIVGSKELLERFKYELEKTIPLNNTISENGKIYSYMMSSFGNIVKVAEFLYNDATIYLDRKYEQYIRLKEEHNKRTQTESGRE